MALPVDTRRLRRERCERAVSVLDSEFRGSALYWCLRPTLFEVFEPAVNAGPLSDASRLHRMMDRVGAGSGMRYRQQGPAVFTAFTRTEARVLRAVLQARTAAAGPPGPLSARGVRPSAMAALRDVPGILSAVRDVGREAGLQPDLVRLARKMVRAAVTLAESGDIFARGRGRVVVVSNQHSPGPRAVILQARRNGVTSVYVPHAPAADTAFYADLPVSVAGLRGELERDHYLALGADADGLLVVGDPTVEAPHRVPVRPDGPVLLALSPCPEGELRRMVEVVEAAELAEVIVAPHPSSELRTVREVIPDRWEIQPGRTYELMRAGPVAVLQRSSGVGLEALSLGLPTVELAFRGVDPSYPFIQEPYVSLVHDSADLAAAVGHARSVSASERQLFVEWARGWRSRWGPDAASAAASLVDSVGSSRSTDRAVLDRFPLPA